MKWNRMEKIKIMHQYLGENQCDKIRGKLTKQKNIAYLVGDM